MPSYPVMEPLKHNGEDYGPGDSVEMDAKAAKDLLLLGVLSPATKASTKTTTKAESKTETKPEDESPAKGGDGSGQAEGEKK